MAVPKILAWNCGGLRSHSVHATDKALFFEKEFSINFHMAFFLETHQKSKDDVPRVLLRYENTHHVILSPTPKDESHSGILALISHEYEVLETKELLKGRILNVKLKNQLDGKHHNIFAVYFETNKRLTKEKVKDITELLDAEMQDHDNNMIIGDFNFIDHARDKVNGLTGKDKVLCGIWAPFLEKFDMVDPFRQHNPRRIIWSFNGVGRSRIDRVYVNYEQMNNITNIQYISTGFHGHKLLSFSKLPGIEIGKGYYKMNTSMLTDPKYHDIVKNAVDEANALQASGIYKWLTFLSTIKADSIVYSQNKASVKKKLKSQVLKEMQSLEESGTSSVAQYDFLSQKLRDLEKSEIEGYKARIKHLPTFHKDEPDIAFFAKVESRCKSNAAITQLAPAKNEKIYTDNASIIRIAKDFYTNLFTPNKVNAATQDRLLRNIENKISEEEKKSLDSKMIEKEARTAVFGLKEHKSPGLDGVPVEFYQWFWDDIKGLYLGFLNELKREAIPKGKNTSVIKLIYKKSGEIYLLTNYRPISLINVDIKILTKILANRLKFVLPSIIHTSQTAVFGRKIDQTVHLIRDLIQLANDEDDQVAFIFLDQEKAFDRVNHTFLFKTMRAFGIGEVFIGWVRKLYSNATSILNVNGHFSDRIPLKRGVRQGCPLSALLYVLVIEVFALQLRSNPNIVGFTVGGEKIVSAHYMDDTTITIRQNRCFKEVIKEISDYEEASDAKVNYKKTKGLWTGSWKNRRVPPMDITWTSKNVFSLGVFFGNKDPAKATFEQILPKFRKKLNYWKQFSITLLGKANVAETFLASKLVYAMKFYPIPREMQREIQSNILSYVIFPNKVITVAQKEMLKTKHNGGLKLVNIQLKSETSKAKWLIEIASREICSTNLNVFTRLLGIQRGGIKGVDLLFLQKPFYTRSLKSNSFYKEALLAMSLFIRKKGVSNIDKWDTEHIFYNPLLLNENGKTFILTKYFEERKIYSFGQLLEESSKLRMRLPHDKAAVRLYEKIHLAITPQQHEIELSDGTPLKFTKVSQKKLYEEALMRTCFDHHSQAKWATRLRDILIPWDDLWKGLHENCLLSNRIKTTIWQQLHLNFYTQFSYNKWHNTHDCCPLCKEIPESIYHILLECEATRLAWDELEITLYRIFEIPVSDEEKSVGIVQQKPTEAALLRNFLTFVLRQAVADAERECYYAPRDGLHSIKTNFRKILVEEVFLASLRGKNQLKGDLVDNVLTFNSVVCDKDDDGSYHVKDQLFLSGP